MPSTAHRSKPLPECPCLDASAEADDHKSSSEAIGGVGAAADEGNEGAQFREEAM